MPKAGLEPARISTVDFESTASTDFATSALKGCGKRWGLYRDSLLAQQLSAICGAIAEKSVALRVH